MAIHKSFFLNLFTAKHAEQILVALNRVAAKKSSPVEANLHCISGLHHEATHDVLQNHFFVCQQHPGFRSVDFTVMEPFYGQLSQLGRTETTTQSFKLLPPSLSLSLSLSSYGP
jgi:hypothetical protein